MPGTIELLFLASLLEDSKKGFKCTIFCVKNCKRKIRIIQNIFYENLYKGIRKSGIDVVGYKNVQ